MDGGYATYDEDYAIEDGDEACSLLQDSRRRTPLHINNYLTQMEKLQKQRKQRQRQVRYLSAALGFVTLCGVAWARQSHLEVVTVLFPEPQQANFVPPSTICDTRQCLDLVPRSALDLKSPTCDSVEPALYENLARYVFDAHYANVWRHDPTMQCSKPSVLNFTATAVPDTRFDLCRHHSSNVAIEAVGMFGTSGNVELAKAIIVSRAATAAIGTPTFLSHVSEKWNRSRLQGLPNGVINPVHDDGIWLTVYFPIDFASELNVEVRRKESADAAPVQISTTVAVPPQTGLAAVRLDRQLHQGWPAGEYVVALTTNDDADTEQIVPFTVLPTSAIGQYAVFREKYDLVWPSPANVNATDSDMCASASENLTAYCACQRRQRQH
ncbi:hypothetical protein H310_10800 [Aphanomyces invadans]|uniref:Uncharacterized protein n=1 Tax=Aphanomyces invadans TaxID=157072 RepID=A0A024TQ22_9STRA|nr:hypothetical protein H310_10800 [Aphanomyces invadans]ETV95726.1 hypothetical protein H310_10800 [Aphanomyces invadans]|eukprot:XP_008875477.1 hypothetical protein H310_10800 [Aphanomyces invadans]